jgi:CBS domain-containing protein
VPTLADIMRAEVIEVAPEDTLGEVAERMSEVNVGAVIVKDYGRLIGILTERDMLKAMAARVHTSDARVREWMTEDPVTASTDMDLEDAGQVMLERNFRHLPVTDESGAVVGLVSLRRLVAATKAASHRAA